MTVRRVVSIAAITCLALGAMGAVAWAVTWSTVTLDTDCGYNCSITVSGTTGRKISHSGVISEYLLYSWYDGFTWYHETVDSTAANASTTSIAYGASARPRIAYCIRTPGSRTLTYAQRGSSSWSTEIVDSSGAPDMPALALDSSYNPYIAYIGGAYRDLMLASWDGSQWDIETVDSVSEVRTTSLTLDANGYPHIAYGHQEPYYGLDLNYAYWDGAQWNIDTVDYAGDTGWTPSIALDSNGYPHIAYVDADNDSLRYASWDGAKWTRQTAYAGNVRGCDMALDGADRPHIAFRNYDDLLYAHWSGSWSWETVESADYGGAMSIALNPSGDPQIAYGLGDDLHFATAGAPLAVRWPRD